MIFDRQNSPIFEIIQHSNGNISNHIKIYLDGKVEGIDGIDNCIIVNRTTLLLQEVVAVASKNRFNFSLNRLITRLRSVFNKNTLK
jgi:hypothetical protein